MKTWYGDQDLGYSLLDSEFEDIRQLIKDKYSSQSCQYYRQQILKTEQPEITPLGDDWTEITKDDLEFEEEEKQSAPLYGVLGRVRNSIVGANSSIKILPTTPHQHNKSNLKTSIFGIAGKIKGKFKKPEEDKLADPYMRQLSSEYDNSSEDD